MSFEDYKKLSSKEKEQRERTKEMIVLVELIIADAERIIARANNLADFAKSISDELD